MQPPLHRLNNATPTPTRRRSGTFLERTLAGFVDKTEHALFAEEIARTDGLLQRLDPRVKIVGLLALVVTVTLSRNLFTIIAIFAVGLVLAVLSRVPIRFLATRIWLSALFFTGAIAIPVIFITVGDPVAHLPILGWTITSQGVTSALYLISRVEATATLSVLLVLCTSWTNVLKGLRVLHVPVVFVVILGMTYRYIFVILETARDMFEARRSRLVGRLAGPERRRIAAGSIGVLLTKSFYLHHEVFLAMQSRGFRGEVYVLDEFAMLPRDWAALCIFAVLAAAAFWLGRQDALHAVWNLGF